MSYEGYTEYRCSHCKDTTAQDVYAGDDIEDCRCGKGWTHERSVDQTNDPEVKGPWRKIEPDPFSPRSMTDEMELVRNRYHGKKHRH